MYRRMDAYGQLRRNKADRFLQLCPAATDSDSHTMDLAAARESQAELGHWTWARKTATGLLSPPRELSAPTLSG